MRPPPGRAGQYTPGHRDSSRASSSLRHHRQHRRAKPLRRGSGGSPQLAGILEAAADPNLKSPAVVAGSDGRGTSRASLQVAGAGGGGGALDLGPFGSSDAAIPICTLLSASGITR
jgi:hypothetical protein